MCIRVFQQAHKKGKMSNKTHRSKTDPDAKLARKGEGGAKLAHGVNYLMDNKHQIIIGVKAERPDRGKIFELLSITG